MRPGALQTISASLSAALAFTNGIILQVPKNLPRPIALCLLLQS